MWDDTLIMTVLPLAKIGNLLNRPEYVEKVTYQFLMYVQNLMIKRRGCGYTAGDMRFIITSSNARWARGNSWMTIVIPDFLELLDLSENNAVRCYLV